MNFEVRKAKSCELDFLFSLHESLFRADIERIWGWDVEWQRRNFEKEFQEWSTFSILWNDKVVGYLQYRADPNCIYLSSLAILPDFQNRGIGTKILSQLCLEADGLKKTLKLSVFHTNESAMRFYGRSGFQVVGQTADSLKMERQPELNSSS